MAVTKKTTRKKAPAKKKAIPRKKKTVSTKPSNRGGAREGAGAKPHKKTVLSKELVENILQDDGETPLEYMIRVMRSKDDDLDEMERNGKLETADKIKIVAMRNERRDKMAEKAAPFAHPRLAAIAMNDGVSAHEQWLDLISNGGEG